MAAFDVIPAAFEMLLKPWRCHEDKGGDKSSVLQYVFITTVSSVLISGSSAFCQFVAVFNI